MSKRILLVEDEMALFEISRRNLVRNRYEVVHAKDGVEALSLAGAVGPDLILLDINLDKLNPDSPDGWEVNRRLKADPATAGIPVLAVTAGAGQVECRERALSEGFAEHFRKPINFPLLLSKIAELVNREAP